QGDRVPGPEAARRRTHRAGGRRRRDHRRRARTGVDRRHPERARPAVHRTTPEGGELMFTGIVEELGELVGRDGTVVTVRGPKLAAGLTPGESIAVNGVCLTVTGTGHDGWFTADVMRETFDRSTLGTLRAGEPVNLERAATLSTR